MIRFNQAIRDIHRRQHQHDQKQEHRSTDPSLFQKVIPPESAKEIARDTRCNTNPAGNLCDLGLIEPPLLDIPQLIKGRRA